jgi:hypothetical protein
MAEVTFMDNNTQNQFKAQQRASAYAGQTPIPIEPEDYSPNILKSIGLRDSTSEWEKQKEALKKINHSISNKNQKNKENHTEQDSTHQNS